MFVPLDYVGAKGWIFDLVCPGNAMSVSHERLLLLKNATVNRNISFDNVCKDKFVLVVYNNRPDTFEVSAITAEMVRFPVYPVVRYWPVVWEWETQAAFFKFNNITPHWINCRPSL